MLQILLSVREWEAQKGSRYQENWRQQSPKAEYPLGLERKRRVVPLGVVRRPALGMI